jgi:hypothetical protein
VDFERVSWLFIKASARAGAFLDPSHKGIIFQTFLTHISKKHLNEPNQPRKPRALTYTEMMNGGQQQMDDVTHQQELNLERRKDVFERSVEHLEQSLKTEIDLEVDRIGGDTGI